MKRLAAEHIEPKNPLPEQVLENKCEKVTRIGQISNRYVEKLCSMVVG
jgi:hypothetical protein